MARRRKNYNYRNVYLKHHGTIPKDANGRSFDVHHINGNHMDDRIENLIALSIEDRYRVHLSRGDIAACKLISNRIGLQQPDSSGKNNSFYGKKHTTESIDQMVRSRKKSGNGDYLHGHLPGTLPQTRSANRKRMNTRNPMQVPGAAKAMQGKRVATLTSFKYWKSTHFDKLENAKDIEEFLVNTPNATEKQLIEKFNLKLDFSKSIIRRFQESGVLGAAKEGS